MSLAKKRYDQIRYIAANGMERVRVNFAGGKPVWSSPSNPWFASAPPSLIKTELNVESCFSITLPKTFLLERRTVRIGANVGAAIFPDHEGIVEALIKQADSAMYKAKTMGKNT